jgi:prenyl protein peptidase
MGLPRFWGCVEGGGAESIIGPDAGGSKRNEDSFLGAAPGEPKKLGVLWSFAYYILLVAGAALWWKYLWILSASEMQLLEL